MSNRTKLGLGILDAALILGVLGDALLRVTPWGLNVLLWTGGLVTATTVLVCWQQINLGGEGRRLVLPAMLFAAAFAWRDSPTLKFLDGMALVVALSLAAGRARTGRIVVAAVTDYFRETLAAVMSAVFGAWPLLRNDVEWKDVPRAGWSRYALAIGRGFALAVPLLLVFGGLLMAADAVFEKIVNNVFQVDLSAMVLHVLVAFIGAWLVGGFLRMALIKDKTDAVSVESGAIVPSNNVTLAAKPEDTTRETLPTFTKHGMPRALRLPFIGIVEVGLALGLLDALFLCFVVVQFRYFFGGAALVETTTGLTYAEYARRGFFELVTVAALVLPLLLVAHWLLQRKGNILHESIFRALAGGQIALLFVIMMSAMARMRLYQNEYGLTELRLYTMAFMGWLAAVFIWFALTVLRGKRERYVCGALVAGFVVVIALHLVNPDAFIVRANIAHAGKTNQTFDVAYATSLSADAVPALVELLPVMNRREARTVSAYVLERWSAPAHVDYRAWSVSRSAAWQATRRREDDLRELAREAKETEVAARR